MTSIFRQPPAWKDDNIDRWGSLRLARDSTELSCGLRSFRSCRLQCERLALGSSSEAVLLNADGKRSGEDRISFVTCSTQLSPSSIVFLPHCLIMTATDKIKSASLMSFSISACIKVSDCHQLLKWWLSVSSRSPQWIITATTFSTNEKEESSLPSVGAQYHVRMTFQRGSSTRFLNILFLFSCWAVSIADYLSIRISDLSSSIIILTKEESALAGVIWFLSSLLPAWYASWAMSSKCFFRRLDPLHL